MHPDPNTLARLHPLAHISQPRLEELARSLTVECAPPGTLIIERGSNKDFSLFLLRGRLKLQAADGDIVFIESGTESAKDPVSQLRPRKYEVTAATEIEYVRIDNQLIESGTHYNNVLRQKREHGLHIIDPEAIEFESQLGFELYNDLKSDKLILPTLPEVAARIGQALEEDLLSTDELAEIIQTDPAITTKLIRVANSAFYRGRDPVDTCNGAIVRLGLNTTKNLVLSFVLQDLFHTNSAALRTRMQQLWQHSTQIASLCFVLAGKAREFLPERALLAGLVHDIGVVAVLSYAEKYAHVTAIEPKELDQTIAELRGQIGAMILRQWEFPSDLVTVALQAEDWNRDAGLNADYCDLVIVAQLHSYIGTPVLNDLPSLDSLPAFNKLQLGELTPQMSLKIIEDSEHRIKHAESLLHS